MIKLASCRATAGYLIWHDRFKTNVLAQAATFGLVAGDTTPITNDNTDIHAKVTNENATSATAKQAVSDTNTSRAEDTTDLTTSKPTSAGADQTGGTVQLDFDKSVSDGVNIYAKRGDEADFTFLARDTAPAAPNSDEGWSHYIDNRPLLAAGKPELPALPSLGEGGREYKCVYVLNDEEIGLLGDKVVVNCAP